MEERLDDAINVLRNHAESPHPSFHPGLTSVPSHLAAQQHSNGLLGYPPALESHLVSLIPTCPNDSNFASFSLSLFLAPLKSSLLASAVDDCEESETSCFIHQSLKKVLSCVHNSKMDETTWDGMRRGKGRGVLEFNFEGQIGVKLVLLFASP